MLTKLYNSQFIRTGDYIVTRKFIVIFVMGLLFLNTVCSKNPSDQDKDTSPAQTLPETIKTRDYTFARKWVDDLDRDNAGWAFGTWTFSNNECEFTPANASFNNSIMTLKISTKAAANTGAYPDKPYWGAEYYTRDEYLYGRFVVRMKATTPSGVVTSFFLYHYGWDDSKNRFDNNEIDIEFAGRTDQVHYTLHWKDPQGDSKSTSVIKPLAFDAADDFHLWEIEWTPTHVAYYIDGTLSHTFTDSTAVTEQEYAQSIRMNYWISSARGWVGPFNPAVLPTTTAYDFVAYYRLVEDAR